ncbi:hypothetical protein H6G74_07605 [Nostoc spongiaeforme FACHB-130]|uniref:Uncharacterized protein n=1 Tax=Nostoc spongiaeforme FACHB-130 TaxID=1357510 RepID=A0ABR8FVT2_9NOSO|nr:hypothetical protein [Nostoc spongiaeforme]MBD2594194.1 hypothetical protein [Nostoc spongiaeforme FACHB-130]
MNWYNYNDVRKQRPLHRHPKIFIHLAPYSISQMEEEQEISIIDSNDQALLVGNSFERL